MRGLLLLLVGTFAGAASASTFYVSPRGNDAWDGLCEQWDGATCGPERTIQAGIDAAETGDTVIRVEVAVTYADIDPFVAALSGPDAWPNPACPWVNADCTGDGNVTFGDIDPFVARLGQ